MGITVYLAAALVFVVAIAGAGWKGYSLGGDHVRAEYSARDLKQSAEAAASIKQLEDAARAKEQQAATAQAAISKDYQRKLANAETSKIAALDALHAHSLILRDPGADAVGACAGGRAETSAAASGRDGGAGGQLSQIAGEFLLSEAARADQVVEQLSACQAVIRADRM